MIGAVMMALSVKPSEVFSFSCVRFFGVVPRWAILVRLMCPDEASEMNAREGR